jgi:hypothetical protein
MEESLKAEVGVVLVRAVAASRTLDLMDGTFR